MKIENHILFESARGDLYKGLSDCFYLPEAQLCDRLQQMEHRAATIASKALTPILLMRDSFADPASLRVDFSKLFVGPYALPAPPYGSVYMDGERQVMGRTTLDVIDRYHEAGLDISAHFKDAPDHVSAELEFMYYLVFKAVEAFRSGDLEAVEGYLFRRHAFLEDHLNQWVPIFSRQIRSHAGTEFYRNLADVLEAVVADDYEYTSTLGLPEAMAHGH